MRIDRLPPRTLHDERGIALITTLLVLMLISALLVGFTTVVMSDQRYRFIDRDRGQAFYAASGGIEKLTADLGNVFYKNLAPSGSQVEALTAARNKPVIDGVTFVSGAAPSPLGASELSSFFCYNTPGIGGTVRTVRSVGGNGYTISYCSDTANNPTTTAAPTLIQSGPYADLLALKTPYQLDVTARTGSGGEVHLVRTIASVTIPVFQFGIFSEVDLAFNAADDFSFGGRVHTNGNLFLAEGNGSVLTINSKITALKEIIRQRLSNGVSIDDSGHTGVVTIAKDSGTYLPMLRTWGSLLDGPSSAVNPLWQGVSLTTYKGYVRNHDTGAKSLQLPLITIGGTTPDVTRRPVVGENTSNPLLLNQRLFTKASLRILLSDTAADITSLPGVTSKAPVLLDGDWSAPATRPADYLPISAQNPPVALSPGTMTGNGSGTGTGSTVTFSATPGAFKPTFRFDGTTGTIVCTGKTTVSPWELIGCTGLTGGAVPANTILRAISPGTPAGGGRGAFAETMHATTPAATSIEFENQALLNRFSPMPFWDWRGTLVTCTGYTATTYTGCSKAEGGEMKSNLWSAAGTGLIGGYIKIERQDSTGVWTDITMEILNYGIGGPNLDGADCGDPAPKAIVRLQRLRDNGFTRGGAVPCNYAAAETGATDPANWWPNVLYDAREGVLRDSDYPGAQLLTHNGVMHYVALDVMNLSKWFRGQAPYDVAGSTGTSSITDSGGFTVYFSDRRNNRDESSKETGEYGWEDHVNPNVVNGAPNFTLDAGENVNGSVSPGTTTPTQQLYGGHPNYKGVYNAVPLHSSGVAVWPYMATASPATTITDPQSRVNRAIFFRRALKLIKGSDIRSIGVTGLTVVSENPVYVHGDWNANPGGVGGFTGAHAATAIIADAVTLLSGAWSDVTSIKKPYDPAARPRTPNTWYRVAVLAGKSLIFPRPSGTDATFGTDGGAHAFLHYLEGRPASADTINYWGSLATLYYSRQATGVFKGNQSTVYQVPANRVFAFDNDFRNPALLPPNTPAFRDMNAVGFSQDLRPGR